jgi:hypothetical protein
MTAWMLIRVDLLTVYIYIYIYICIYVCVCLCVCVCVTTAEPGYNDTGLSDTQSIA